MSDFVHIMSRLMEQPLLVRPDYLNVVLALISQRRMEADHEGFILPDMELPVGARYSALTDKDMRDAPQGVALINVLGSTAHRPGQMTAGMSSNMRTYQGIVSDAKAAMSDDKVKGLLFYHNSPGGEARGNFAAVREVMKMRGNKPMWSLVDEMSASASYNLSAATDRIIGPAEMQVGSIGAVAAHQSMQGALEQKGIKVTLVASGKHKIEGNPINDLSAEEIDRFQSRINEMGEKFAGLVALNRGLNVKDVMGLEADVLSGDDALQAGLVDEVMSVDEAFDAFVEHCNGASHTTIQGISMSGPQGVEHDASAVVNTANLEVEQAKEAAKLENARVRGIYALASARQSDVHMQLADSYVEAGMSVEAADTALKLTPTPAAAEQVSEPGDALGIIEQRAASQANEVNAELSETHESDQKGTRVENMVRNFAANTGNYFANSRVKVEARKGGAH